MSDRELRELERAWRASGDPADEERWHLARVRAGVTPGWAWEVVQLLRLPLPARPGLVARLFTAAEQRGAEQERERLRDALRILARDSLEGYDRALVAVGEHVLARGVGLDPPARHFRRALDELATRVLSPGPLPERIEVSLEGTRDWARRLARELVARLRGAPPAPSWADAPQYGTERRPTGTLRVWTTGELQGDALPPAGVVPALARELIPWLLGVGDPLRERAERALDDVRVASPCDVPWEDMPGDERTRVCGECRMTVYDLSALDRAEAAALLRQHQGQRLCVQLYRRADGRIHTRDCPVDPTLARRAVKGMRA